MGKKLTGLGRWMFNGILFMKMVPYDVALPGYEHNYWRTEYFPLSRTIAHMISNIMN